ncbi:hypothetical protein J6590_012229 [Homalodisca vitripennis]|nr:hypothetical protein J6590_012229 [Homalodisca vitripennis]
MSTICPNTVCKQRSELYRWTNLIHVYFLCDSEIWKEHDISREPKSEKLTPNPPKKFPALSPRRAGSATKVVVPVVVRHKEGQAEASGLCAARDGIINHHSRADPSPAISSGKSARNMKQR